MMMNRNKRGIAVDFKQRDGREIGRRLLGTADVVIENFRKGTMERLGLGYDVAAREQSGVDLLRGVRLRAHRALCRARRLRSDRAEHVRPDEHHRRGAGQSAGQVRRTGHRHHRRHSRRDGRARGIHASIEDRQRPARRRLAVRGGHRAHLLAICDRARHRYGAGTARLGASVERAVSGVRDRRRLDHDRRGQPGELAQAHRCARGRHAQRRCAFRDQCLAHGQSSCARGGAERAVQTAQLCENGCNASKTPACQPVRCSTSFRCTQILRRRHARWWSKSRTAASAK